MVPVAIRYLFQGDIQETAGKILTDIEQRLSWKPQTHLLLVDRIYKVGLALLSLKEMEYLGAAQEGTHDEPTGTIDRPSDASTRTGMAGR